MDQADCKHIVNRYRGIVHVGRELSTIPDIIRAKPKTSFLFTLPYKAIWRGSRAKKVLDRLLTILGYHCVWVASCKRRRGQIESRSSGSALTANKKPRVLVCLSCIQRFGYILYPFRHIACSRPVTQPTPDPLATTKNKLELSWVRRLTPFGSGVGSQMDAIEGGRLFELAVGTGLRSDPTAILCTRKHLVLTRKASLCLCMTEEQGTGNRASPHASSPFIWYSPSQSVWLG